MWHVLEVRDGTALLLSNAAVIPALILDLDSTVYEYAGVCTINGYTDQES